MREDTRCSYAIFHMFTVLMMIYGCQGSVGDDSLLGSGATLRDLERFCERKPDHHACDAVDSGAALPDASVPETQTDAQSPSDAQSPIDDASLSPTTCTSFTYSDWGACQPDGTQTRTVVSSSPEGCTGGTPVLTQSCTPSTSAVCTDPFFTTSDPNGGITIDGYYVHNNLWNAASYPGTTGTTEVCSSNSFNHVGYASNSTGDGAVKTYPNVHKNYSGRTISSFSTLTSTFAATSPGVGIYNVAYDIWLNGVPNDEVMIWTDNHNQVPAGSRFASGISLSGRTWDVYATHDNGYIAFVPSNGARYTSGMLDIKAMLDYLVRQGRVAANATVDQICYGVEIVDTAGSAATWNFTDFSIIDS